MTSTRDPVRERRAYQQPFILDKDEKHKPNLVSGPFHLISAKGQHAIYFKRGDTECGGSGFVISVIIRLRRKMLQTSGFFLKNYWNSAVLLEKKITIPKNLKAVCKISALIIYLNKNYCKLLDWRFHCWRWIFQIMAKISSHTRHADQTDWQGIRF